MSQAIHSLENDQDIPVPGRRKMLDVNDLYSHRPPPSLAIKYGSNQNNDDGLKTISNVIVSNN